MKREIAFFVLVIFCVALIKSLIAEKKARAEVEFRLEMCEKENKENDRKNKANNIQIRKLREKSCKNQTSDCDCYNSRIPDDLLRVLRGAE